MANYGFTCVNQGNELTVSDATQGYRYLGLATLNTSATLLTYDGGGYTYGFLDNWIYEYTMSNSTDAPVFGIELQSGIVVANYARYAGSNRWEFSLFSVQDAATNLDDISHLSLQTPKIHVFGPYSAPTAGEYGLVLYTADNKVAFSTSQEAMTIKSVISIGSAQTLSFPPSGAWTPSNALDLIYDGEDLGASPVARPVIISNTYGGGTATAEGSLEDIWQDSWGLSLVSGRIRRRRFIVNRYPRDYDNLYDYYETYLEPGNVLVLDGTRLS
jgi:hypothetical protein